MLYSVNMLCLVNMFIYYIRISDEWFLIFFSNFYASFLTWGFLITDIILNPKFLGDKGGWTKSQERYLFVSGRAYTNRFALWLRTSHEEAFCPVLHSQWTHIRADSHHQLLPLTRRSGITCSFTFRVLVFLFFSPNPEFVFCLIWFWFFTFLRTIHLLIHNACYRITFFYSVIFNYSIS